MMYGLGYRLTWNPSARNRFVPMHIALILLSLIWLLVVVVVVGVCLMAARDDRARRLHPSTAREVSLAGALRSDGVHQQPPVSRSGSPANAAGPQTAGRRRRRGRRSQARLGAN
jgi:hypothetical protein